MTNMGIFALKNLTLQYRTLSRCKFLLQNKSFRYGVSSFHTVVGNRLSAGSFSNAKFTDQWKSSAFDSHGNSSFLYRLRLSDNTFLCIRLMSTKPAEKNNVLFYVVALVITMIGMSYAGVPLYKIFCQQMGLGGSAELARAQNAEKVVGMESIPDRKITVSFAADRHSSLQWNFRPQQDKIVVSPGETALAFYTANNPTEEPIIGVATYSVVPYQAATYFHKIQCFCFEEQILNPHEQVDMPVFFYIDPDYDSDPELEEENHIVLSYTFFEAKDGVSLPVPGYPQPGQTNYRPA